MFKEFKEFALNGSFADLALGVIIGTAVGKVVSSLVTDLIMPPIGALLGKVDFAAMYVNLSGTAFPTYAAAKAAGAPVLDLLGRCLAPGVHVEPGLLQNLHADGGEVVADQNLHEASV